MVDPALIPEADDHRHQMGVLQVDTGSTMDMNESATEASTNKVKKTSLPLNLLGTFAALPKG